MKVTADMLREKGACEDQVRLFEREWPDGTRITKRACLRAVKLGLDLDWFASKFLNAKQCEAYDKATATAREAYIEAIAPAWEAYIEAIAPAREAYIEAIAPAREAYEKATASALWEASKVK